MSKSLFARGLNKIKRKKDREQKKTVRGTGNGKQKEQEDQFFLLFSFISSIFSFRGIGAQPGQGESLL